MFNFLSQGDKFIQNITMLRGFFGNFILAMNYCSNVLQKSSYYEECS